MSNKILFIIISLHFISTKIWTILLQTITLLNPSYLSVASMDVLLLQQSNFTSALGKIASGIYIILASLKHIAINHGWKTT
jgi:hypothetical protein